MEPTQNTALRVAIAMTGLTQRVIAKRCHIHEARFSAIARGRINPNGREQKRIARVLNTTVDHLFGSRFAEAVAS